MANELEPLVSTSDGRLSRDAIDWCERQILAALQVPEKFLNPKGVLLAIPDAELDALKREVHHAMERERAELTLEVLEYLRDEMQGNKP